MTFKTSVAFNENLKSPTVQGRHYPSYCLMESGHRLYFMSASVADPHRVDADPDPSFHSYAVPDLGPHPHQSDAESDPTTHFSQIWTLQCSQMTL
jgi:hypothetical protein